MKIWVHGYTLKPRSARMAARRGALLKIEWAVGQIGYSDIHPWPEFGEAPLDVHLEALSSMTFTRLAELSLEFNYIDREFRQMKRNAFLGLIIPRSHRLLSDVLETTPDQIKSYEKEGFTHLKIKMGADLANETKAWKSLAKETSLLWRLDLSGRVEAAAFTEWWNDIEAPLKKKIDFIEDPIPGGKLPFDGPWANDWHKIERAKIRIIKPARENVEEVGHFNRVVFTHGLDHVFGQACAAWTAGRFYSAHPRLTDVCALSSHDIYEEDEFSQDWKAMGPRLKPTSGLGFGFDEQLESVKWERLF